MADYPGGPWTCRCGNLQRPGRLICGLCGATVWWKNAEKEQPMGDRKQPTPRPTDQFRPTPPPAPPSARNRAVCRFGVYCRDHGFIHGAEAEELREKLAALNNPRVNAILDDVDARDSLAYLEWKQREEGRVAHE